jgi:hypothetical protein
MYKEHPVFKKIPDDTKIWRYIDFAQFVSLLDTRSLHFIRVDRLEDPFEGIYSKANIKLAPEVYRNKIPIEIIEKLTAFKKDGMKGLRACIVINSWHINDYESAALWELYSKKDQGIAIQSTFKKLVDSVKNYQEDIFIGPMNYIDYENDWLPESNLFHLFTHKRKSFEHERELRALILRFPKHGDNSIDFSKNTFEEEGIDVPVDLDLLIERIYVSPEAEGWFMNLVKSVASRYNLNKQIQQSSLSEGLKIK